MSPTRHTYERPIQYSPIILWIWEERRNQTFFENLLCAGPLIHMPTPSVLLRILQCKYLYTHYTGGETEVWGASITRNKPRSPQAPILYSISLPYHVPLLLKRILKDRRQREKIENNHRFMKTSQFTILNLDTHMSIYKHKLLSKISDIKTWNIEREKFIDSNAW